LTCTDRLEGNARKGVKETENMERQEWQNTTPNQRDEDQPPSEDVLTALARAWAEVQVESADDVFNQLVDLLQEQQQRREGGDKEKEETEGSQLDLGLVTLIDRANQVWDDLNHRESDPPATTGGSSEGRQQPELAKQVASKLLRKHARLHVSSLSLSPVSQHPTHHTTHMYTHTLHSRKRCGLSCQARRARCRPLMRPSSCISTGRGRRTTRHALSRLASSPPTKRPSTVRYNLSTFSM
jgi:hypothetical protein